MRTILAGDVKDKDYVFPYSEIGPGFYVVRCELNTRVSGVMHHFDEDPFKYHRLRVHTQSYGHKRACHTADQAVVLENDAERIRKFGYRGALLLFPHVCFVLRPRVSHLEDKN